MILAKLALRNLSRQKRRSILLGGALAFGMFILVGVNGFTGGLIGNLQNQFANLIAGHLYFVQFERADNGKLLNLVKDDQPLREALAALEAQGFRAKAESRRTAINGSVLFNGEGIARQVTGVDWGAEPNLASSLSLVAGTADRMAGSDGIILSTSLAEGIGLLPKKKVSFAERSRLRRDLRAELDPADAAAAASLESRVDAEVKRLEAERLEIQRAAAPQALGEIVLVQLNTIYGQQNLGEFRVAGLYEAQFDIAAYVDRDRLNALADMPPGSYNLFGLTLDDSSNLQGKTFLLAEALKGRTRLWPQEQTLGRGLDTIISDINKTEFEGTLSVLTNLNNEMGQILGVMYGVQAGSFGLFVVILSVIMIGLVNTFRMVIYERTKEIGTMRALGTQRTQVRNLFLFEALFLTLGGTLSGALLGLLGLALLGAFEFSALTELALFLNQGRFSISIDPGLLVSSFVMVIGFTLLAAWLPARRAAKLEPAQALRTQF